MPHLPAAATIFPKKEVDQEARGDKNKQHWLKLGTRPKRRA
jgi:hypothetical protein